MKLEIVLSIITLFQVISIVKADDDNNLCFECKCFDKTVDCMNSNLNEIPKQAQLPKNTDTLILTSNLIRSVQVFEPSGTLTNISYRHNLIDTIANKAFENLSNLTYLDLSHNLLLSESLKPIKFKGPDDNMVVGLLPLKVLKLGSNLLHTLDKDLFEFLPNIEELDLSSNPFKVLDYGTMAALSNLHKLKKLDLSSTQLSSIPRLWLNAAKDLETINLSMNNLTDIPWSLDEARALRHLILDHNPILVIKYFPPLHTLEILDLNWMPKLNSIRAHSLVNLTHLKELNIANNHYLSYISEDTLVEPGSYAVGSNEGVVFPPLEKLDLSNNRLGYLEQGLIERWENLKVLKLDSNPWICDCKNQWMVSFLVHVLNEKNVGQPETLICGEPVEMKGKSMMELALREYKMRCLDYYGNEPDKDAKVLIIVLVVVLIAIPVSLLFLHLVKRPRARSGYPSAYYRRAHSFESVN